MTLENFITATPKELRLGQHFYNTYFSFLRAEHNTHKNMDLLFYTTNTASAVLIVKEIMKAYQWEELPNV